MKSVMVIKKILNLVRLSCNIHIIKNTSTLGMAAALLATQAIPNLLPKLCNSCSFASHCYVSLLFQVIFTFNFGGIYSVQIAVA